MKINYNTNTIEYELPMTKVNSFRSYLEDKNRKWFEV